MARKRRMSAFAKQARDARKIREREALVAQLGETPRAELMRIAMEDRDSPLHQAARLVLATRECRTWESIRKSYLAELRAQRKARAAAEAQRKPEVPKQRPQLPSPTQAQLHPNGARRRRRSRTLPSVYQEPGNDFLKPFSKEFDMPEYDLE